MHTHPLIAIVGSGAVGGYYGARLAQHGHHVHFLLRGDFDAVRRNGWTIRSCHGDFTIPADKMNAHRDPREMPKADLVVVTLKTTANDQFEPLIRPLLKDDTIILTLQNGLGNEDRLAHLFGKQRVLGGLAFTCINRIGPGAIHHMAEGWLRIGELEGGPTPRLVQIAEMFRASKIDCEVMEDLRRGRWHKLSWNVAFNGPGAVMDFTTDQLINSEEGIALVTSLFEEIIATAKTAGVDFPPDWVRKQIEKTRAMGAYQTSMQIDRRERRPMEIEAILGEPLRQATTAGVPTPRLESIYAMARTIDAERKRTDPNPVN